MGESVVINRFLPWVRSGGRGGLLVLGVVAVQFAIPAIALLAEPPTRFGFQMYSGLGGVQASTIDESGGSSQVDMDEIVAEFRPELDWSTRLPQYICETSPRVTEIVVVRKPAEARRVSCDAF